MFEKEITFDRFIRGLMVVAGLGLAIYIINLLSAVLLPFFIAWFLAYGPVPALAAASNLLGFLPPHSAVALGLALADDA